MSEGLLERVEVGPRNADASVIWLHGLGADGHDFEPIVPQLGLGPTPRVHFVFPHAPHRPVTVNGGYVMRAWFDVIAIRIGAPQDEVGIREAARHIEALIEAEIANGIPSQRIVLAGFSQGGAIALHAALRYIQPLAGVLALSTFLPLADTLEDERHPANQQIPIFLAHGTYDPVVPFDLAELSRQRLIEHDYAVQWMTYPMEHNVHPLEIVDISAWLKGVLSAE